MRKIKFIFISAILLVNGMAMAQKLSDALGAVQTNFLISSDSVNLNAVNQYIIKKAGIFYGSGSDYGYGAGYESFHLEFESDKRLITDYIKKSWDNYLIEFYAIDNRLLATIFLSNQQVKILRNTEMAGNPIFYSIDLIDVPTPLLDKSYKLNIVKIRNIK
jgi:hypothetical protein